jgi:hypothetical protein
MPLGDSFVLTLSGVKQIMFQDLFEGPMSTLEDELEISTPEILNTESETMPVCVKTTTGILILNYENIDFKLDTGQPVKFETIEAVCHEYWNQWNGKGEN